MIARVWRGWTSADEADAYTDYFVGTGMRDSRSTQGNRGSFVLRRKEGDRVEFTTITLWDSLEAIAGFSGSQGDEAVFYPEDDRFLVERERTVDHYELVHADPAFVGDQPV